MAHKSAKFLTAVLASTALVLSPVAAQAGGMGHFGMGGVPSVPKCPQVPSGHPGMNRSVTTNIENNVNVYKPIDINKPVSVHKNIDVNKPVSVYKNVDVNKPVSVYKNIDINKPVSINKTINENKNININNNININKNINNSKNININKNIVINKGSSSSEAEASAIAIALAQAIAASASNSSSSASANGGNTTVNVTGGSSNSSSNSAANAMSSSFSSAAAYNNSSFFSNVAVSSYVPEAPGFVAGGEVNVNVSPAEVVATVAAPQACTFQEATVIKAIHAICVSEDHHEFPASHMVGDTWINAGYEGEIARCLPGSALKVMVGSVIQSSQGAAVSNAHGETLMCAPHEALRHFKNGVLKCALAVPVPDCTERTNLRKFGTGDMFFSYVSKVCLETGRELVGGESRESSSYAYEQHSLRGTASGY